MLVFCWNDGMYRFHPCVHCLLCHVCPCGNVPPFPSRLLPCSLWRQSLLDMPIWWNFSGSDNFHCIHLRYSMKPLYIWSFYTSACSNKYEAGNGPVFLWAFSHTENGGNMLYGFTASKWCWKCVWGDLFRLCLIWYQYNWYFVASNSLIYHINVIMLVENIWTF